MPYANIPRCGPMAGRTPSIQLFCQAKKDLATSARRTDKAITNVFPVTLNLAGGRICLLIVIT